MPTEHRIRMAGTILFALLVFCPAGAAQAQDEGAGIDITNYKIDAELIPDSHTLKAQAAVTFKVLKQTQSAVFEMNGSLSIDKVLGPDGKTALQFIQDKVNDLDVKINLGSLYQPGQEATLTLTYSGQLATPEGGPIPDKRLAYIGPEGSYLFYAARWFPFHGYASDRATSDISLTVPGSWTVVGHSDQPAAPMAAKDGRKTFRFVETKPVLPGSFAAGQFITRSTQSGGYQIEMDVLPGSDARAQDFVQEIALITQTYSTKFGPYAFGQKLTVAEVDDDTLNTYDGAGIIFLAHKMLVGDGPVPDETLARAVALQWWGQAVGLKRFDDEWLSQGLAEYSWVLYEETLESAPEFQATLAQVLESALAFEQDASIARAPAQVNDQSPAYRSIVFYKGAYVYHMLRNIMGDDKFFALLKDYYRKYSGQNAGLDDFEAAADKAAGSKLRGFFGTWVDSTGVPEFHVDYTILRTKEGKFLVRGTLRQNMESFRGPVDVEVEGESGKKRSTTVELEGTSADFEAESDGLPTDVTVDPNNRYLRTSEPLKVAVVVRRGIEHLKLEEYSEAEQQFRDALKLNPRSSWAWYNLGNLFLAQRNWNQAIDAFSQALAGDLEPNWVEVWSYIYRGNAYDAKGERERAVAEYAKARDIGNDYNGAQKAIERYQAQPYKPARTEGD